MATTEDTEWLRAALLDPAFHREYAERWVAVRDGRVAHQEPDRDGLQRWLDEYDRDRQCVLAFADPRPFA